MRVEELVAGHLAVLLLMAVVVMVEDQVRLALLAQQILAVEVEVEVAAVLLVRQAVQA
jgi:hypothetical protein